MGKLTEFSIVLANPQAVYLPGQFVDGHVVVVLSDEMKMRGVRVRFTGDADVHWTETRTTGTGDDRKEETVHYNGHETYFAFEILVFGPGNDSVMLHAGHHTFPFQYTLPMDLPSSYESSIGQVRYKLKATIDRPWKFDHHTRKLFTVVAMLDLNLQPFAAEAGDGEKSKMLCCLCCKSGPISVKFHIDRTGYVPGETILLKAEISNMSNRMIRSSKVKLYMMTTYYATSDSKSEYSKVAAISHGEIGPGDSDIWAEPMVVPAVPPSFLPGCNIIDIRYLLQLDVEPAGPAFDLEVPLTIIVGTVPLRQTMQQAQMFPAVDKTGFSQPLAPSAPFQDSNMAMPPPPSYAECVFGKQAVAEEGENEHTFGDTNFAPVYPYYDWSKPSFQ